MAEKLTTAKFIERSLAVHGNKYDYSESQYTDSGSNISIFCKKHGVFSQKAMSHMKGHGCSLCKAEKASTGLAGNTEKFIKNAKIAHENRYDYSKVIYIRSFIKVEITCPIHGSFWQTPNNHIAKTKPKAGCPRCAGKGMVTDDFIKKSKEIHGDTYSYQHAVYTHIKDKVNLVCEKHGLFFQNAEDHLLGKNCRKCSNEENAENQRYSTEIFIEKSLEIHGDRYDYSKTNYSKSIEHVVISCKKHGDFQQIAAKHLMGRGCNQCWHESYSSKAEQELGQWIASLGLTVINNDRAALKKGLEIDIYLPALRIGIEYNGCYWHSDKIEKNTRKNEFKHRCAQTDDIRLITVWDYDWKTKPEIVKRHMLHAFGLNPFPRISARSCAVAPITGTEANRFYTEHHLQGPCRGGVLHVGLRHKDTLVAAMSFTQGATRRGKNESGEWELARYATSAIVRGGASRLFKYFLDQTDATTVWSFSDRQHFSGNLYITLGFNKDGELPSDYKVVNPYSLTVWHKSLWQRKSIPKRIDELGSSETFDPETDPRTEQQMQDQLHVLRVWDAGKIRWLWKKQPLNGLTPCLSFFAKP